MARNGRFSSLIQVNGLFPKPIMTSSGGVIIDNLPKHIISQEPVECFVCQFPVMLLVRYPKHRVESYYGSSNILGLLVKILSRLSPYKPAVLAYGAVSYTHLRAHE